MATKIQSVEIHGIQTSLEENEWVYLQTETLLKHGYLIDEYNIKSVLEATTKFVIKEYEDIVSVDSAFVAIAFFAGGRVVDYRSQL